MNRSTHISTLTLILLMSYMSSCAAPQAGVKIEEAWARSAPQGANTAVYLKITSLDSDDFWIEVDSPQGAVAELHRSMMQADGTARMEHQDRITLPKNETVELMPGGLHVMLINLYQTLEPGDRVKLTLVFQQHERQEIDVPVKAP